MTGSLLRRPEYRLAYFIAAFLATTALVMAARATDPLIPDAWRAWAIGEVLLIYLALFGHVRDPGPGKPRKFAPRYEPVAAAGMTMAAALLALAPFGFAASSGEDVDADPLMIVLPPPAYEAYVSFAANLLAELCFALLALLAYRQAVLWIAAGLRWVFGRSAFSSAVASRCTPWAVAFFPWLAVVAMTLGGYLFLPEDQFVWAAIFAPALLGASYLQKLSLRTIFSHLSLLGLVAYFLKGETGMGVGIAQAVGGWSPIDFYGDRAVNAMVVYAIVGVAVTLALALKRGLVSEPKDGSAPASLSIYPDSRNYVGDDGYLDRLCRLILQSDGGVIGVTGLRGAGKSALLGAVMDRFRRERCVVWTIAPVSYQSDDKLSFLMSISRALCQKAIDDASGVLYGHRSETQRALEELIRSIRVPIAIGCLVVAGGYLLAGQTSITTPLFGPPPRMPDQVQLRGEQVSLAGATRVAYGFAALSASFEQARAAEVARLSALLARIDAAVAPATVADAPATVADVPATVAEEAVHAITPIPGEAGFDLVAGRVEDFDVSVLVDRDTWLRRDLQLETGPDAPMAFLMDGDGFFHDHHIALDPHGLPKAESRRSFAFLQEEFERRVIGNRTSILFEGIPNFVEAEFEGRVMALAALRGDPRLAPNLAGVNADLRRLLQSNPEGAASRGLISPDWASLVLIAGFYDSVAVLNDSNATDADRTAALDRLFLDDDRLRELRAVLARYIGILEGRTLGPVAAAGDGGSGLFSFRHLSDRASALPDVRYAWLLAALLLVCLLPELWRAGNFVARGLLNFRVLVLMRACSEFMELLNYSEGREASAGFGFRGLTLAGKRTLSARNLTLQSLTDRYQDFVSLLLTFYNGKLIVIIDELDKMSDPQHAKSVLLELKGALFQRGCYYLISISEDAAAAFRNRMAEGRDIFESTFEDVLGIERMSAGAARAMIRRRLAHDEGSAVGIDDQAIGILRVFAGAIPREIVRHLRETVLAAADGKSVEPRLIGLDIFRSELLQWRESLKAAPLPGNDLIRLIEITQEVEAMLPVPDAEWPDLPSRSASIGAKLAECLAVLDPKTSFMEEVYDFHAMETQGAEHQERFRKLAEIQSCLRLMTMNELMRYVWRTGGLDAEQSEAAVTCLRAIMIQPAVAARLLEDVAVRVLGLDYPESSTIPRAGAAPAALVLAADSSIQ